MQKTIYSCVMNILIGIIAALIVLKLLSLRGRIEKKLALELIRDNATLIDVRSPDEFNSFNVNGSINIPHTNISEGINKYNLKKDTPIILYCASGTRSGMALNILKSSGYTNVHNGGTVGYMNKLNNN